MTENVILVDQDDNELGLMEKLEAHRTGKLHRAFSIFVFNRNQELLIQKRAGHKYHSGGLWTNTCCSHPRPGESLEQAAHRRLQEEMGFDCELQLEFHFIYSADFENGLVENELDHVFVGKFDSSPILNPEEASEWRYVAMAKLQAEIDQHPEDFTAWLKIALPKIRNFI